jgi:tRNA(Ile)-lysidine synthase
MSPLILNEPSSDKLGARVVNSLAIVSSASRNVSYSELEKLFKPLVDKISNKQTLAIAVSGGADSMALCLFAAEWTKVSGGKIVALIVDHGLRAGSAAEAQKVASWLAARGVSYRVLTWEEKKPLTGVQAAARVARYRLMRDWCRENNISILMVAHHIEDQVETFLLRVFAGSGLDGLASMQSVSEFNKLFLLRPLLGMSTKRLRCNLRLRKQVWIDDPSNQDPAYQRTRMRRLVLALEKRDFPPSRISSLVKHFSELQVILQSVVDDFFARAVRVRPEGFGVVHRDVFQKLPVPILERVLVQLISIFGNKIYPPRKESLLRAIEKITVSDILGFTLGGCQFIKSGNVIIICRDKRAITAREVTAGIRLNWDGLFDVQIAGPSGAAGRLAALGEKGWCEIVTKKQELKGSFIPYPVRITLPALFDVHGVTQVPGLGYQREGIKTSFLTMSKIIFKPAKHQKL